jgi:hypothetical protein
VQHAEDAVALEHRNAEHHADAPLVEERIRDGRRVDPFEVDRSAGRRDAACEAPTERDAHSLAHLLLDTKRGSRH